MEHLAGLGLGFRWRDLCVAAVTLVLVWSKVRPHIPFAIEDHIVALAHALFARVTPYITVTIDEHAGGDTFGGRSEAYRAAEAYLSSATCAARRLRAEVADGSDRVSLAVGDNEEVVDVFRGGARMWWRKTKTTPFFLYCFKEEERRAYHLTFHRRHRHLVVDSYLPFVLAEGRAVTVRNRQRRLFTNNAGGDDGGAWTHVKLEHPATFAKLAMDPDEKEAIIGDLEMFRDGKDYYAKVGKAWKRGYLLYGPPGTGKSTMIAAMANFLDYDVYDLELTAVKSNSELRRLFIETTDKSIIVIEDIDCSVDLTGKRSRDKKRKVMPVPMSPPMNEEEDEEEQIMKKVTLSGLLNFIDGLWSACGGERIIVFTTNHKDRLDPALIRQGRMDMRIEMSFCRFQAFKVLAKNYLDIDDHELFGEIRRLLEEVDMTPADVAENLMPRSKKRDVHASLAKLVAALNKEALMMAKQNNMEEEDGSIISDDDDDGGSNEEEGGKKIDR